MRQKGCVRRSGTWKGMYRPATKYRYTPLIHAVTCRMYSMEPGAVTERLSLVVMLLWSCGDRQAAGTLDAARLSLHKNNTPAEARGGMMSMQAPGCKAGAQSWCSVLAKPSLKPRAAIMHRKGGMVCIPCDHPPGSRRGRGRGGAGAPNLILDKCGRAREAR